MFEVEQYITDAPQDPHEPVWAPDAEIADMQSVDDPHDTYPGNGNVPSMRTASGELDFLDGITDLVDNFLGRDTPVKPEKPKLDAIRTRELGADKWRGDTRVVTDRSNIVCVESSRRRRVTIVNWGPSNVFLGSIAGVQANSNCVRLPVSGANVYAPRILEIQDNVWAICAPTDTATIDIQEEFDCES